MVTRTQIKERLVSAALIRDGETHSRGFHSHAELRGALGDEDPYQRNMGDVEGFVTSEGRFLTREEAVHVGVTSGQLSPHWHTIRRDLLSSDINW